MAPVTSKKRKLSEFADDSVINGHRPTTKSKPNRKNTQQQAAQLEDESLDAYRPFCLTQKDDVGKNGAPTAHTTIADGLECDYGVHTLKPGIPSWGDMKSYTRVIVSDETFKLGDIIYINHTDPVPPPVSPSFTEDQTLKHYKDNYFLAKIIQARASSDKEVYLLVAWLYWPDELTGLPNSKQLQAFRSSYGAQELIMSNDLAIIDAMTIHNKADVSYFNEWDDRELLHIPQSLFWRQTFDHASHQAGKKGPRALSDLRLFCKCQKPFDTNQPMLHCSNPTCNEWNHEKCLVNNISQRIWPSYTNGQMDNYAGKNSPERSDSLGDQLLRPVKAVGHFLKTEVEEILEQGVEAVQEETSLHVVEGSKKSTNGSSAALATPKRKQGRPRKYATRWEAKLHIEIVDKDGQSLTGVVRERDGEHKTWEVKVDCLCCGRTLD